ncbi:1527_t:CDS:2 [Funneliformis caledonium]|uniref:1527_t:CDS:1 n=1 Tax=Funneliformis caledonium TaxID=1117310 RepID=A0A9N9H246_9GLOM|nr:1527_t:CDS:2 [Funneliformis caledonium]
MSCKPIYQTPENIMLQIDDRSYDGIHEEGDGDEGKDNDDVHKGRDYNDNVRERSGDDYSFNDDINSNNKYNDQDILQYNISDISRKYKQKNIVNIELIKIPEKYVANGNDSYLVPSKFLERLNAQNKKGIVAIIKDIQKVSLHPTAKLFKEYLEAYIKMQSKEYIKDIKERR